MPSVLHLLNLSAPAVEPDVRASTFLEKRSTVPKVESIRQLGTAYDPNCPNVYRDNGGGGQINGINFIVFSDTGMTNGGPNGNLTWFVSNSIAAMVYVCYPPFQFLELPLPLFASQSQPVC